jgi:hypothetical protein
MVLPIETVVAVVAQVVLVLVAQVVDLAQAE